MLISYSAVRGLFFVALHGFVQLTDRPSDPVISRMSKHSGAIKALQFNPRHPNLLASAGAKGEVCFSLSQDYGLYTSNSLSM